MIKENSIATDRFNPNSIPAAIVAPDLEKPGHKHNV